MRRLLSILLVLPLLTGCTVSDSSTKNMISEITAAQETLCSGQQSLACEYTLRNELNGELTRHETTLVYFCAAEQQLYTLTTNHLSESRQETLVQNGQKQTRAAAEETDWSDWTTADAAPIIVLPGLGTLGASSKSDLSDYESVRKEGDSIVLVFGEAYRAKLQQQAVEAAELQLEQILAQTPEDLRESTREQLQQLLAVNRAAVMTRLQHIYLLQDGVLAELCTESVTQQPPLGSSDPNDLSDSLRVISTVRVLSELDPEYELSKILSAASS